MNLQFDEEFSITRLKEPCVFFW